MDWQPIETAPKDGTRVLLSGDGIVGFGAWVKDVGKTLVADPDKPYWEPYDNSYWDIDFTNDKDWFLAAHWMPLPEPPKAQP